METDRPKPIDQTTIDTAILEALADGVHPMTGDPVPGESVFQIPQVLAALRAGADALQKQSDRLARSKDGPRKTGIPWSKEEDAQLADAFDAGEPIEALAEKHQRTDGAIRSRLAKLGKLIP